RYVLSTGCQQWFKQPDSGFLGMTEPIQQAPTGAPIVVKLTGVTFAYNGTAFAANPKFVAMNECVMMEWRKDHTHMWLGTVETDVMETPEAILAMQPIN